MAQNTQNKPIIGGNYDKSLSVKCINGTFVGTKTENIISYKGIPFVGKQPVGDLRWKAPVDVTAALLRQAGPTLKSLIVPI